MKEEKHKCKERDYCICSPIADEPDETCPLHGAGEYPKRCYICGRFMARIVEEARKTIHGV